MLAVETEMNNKNKEIQTLHSSLTEAMVSKERLEQRVMELMEISQHSMQDESLQAQVQVRHCRTSCSLNTYIYFILLFRVKIITRKKWLSIQTCIQMEHHKESNSLLIPNFF